MRADWSAGDGRAARDARRAAGAALHRDSEAESEREPTATVTTIAVSAVATIAPGRPIAVAPGGPVTGAAVHRSVLELVVVPVMVEIVKQSSVLPMRHRVTVRIAMILLAVEFPMIELVMEPVDPAVSRHGRRTEQRESAQSRHGQCQLLHRAFPFPRRCAETDFGVVSPVR